MSTDPTFTVEWTVPTDDEWGGDAPDAPDAEVRVEPAARDTAPTSDDDRLAARKTRDLPPAPVLAARVDHLRSDRDARDRQLDAVRAQYERLLDARDDEIMALRETQTAFGAVVRRVRAWF
jgi:hypothetical protein